MGAYTEKDSARLDAETLRLIGKQAELADIPTLREVLDYHSWHYYVAAKPKIRDAEFDLLFRQLLDLEQAHPDQITPESPTQRLSQALSPDFATVMHNVPMLSLSNAFGIEELQQFVEKTAPEAEWVVEPKLDGSGLTLVYENDRLVRAATRGDGKQGEDITPNVRTLPSVPLTAPFSEYGIHVAEIRGEVVISKDDFAKLNEDRSRAGLPEFQNARNTAAGGLRLKSPADVANRRMQAVMYHISYAVDRNGTEISADTIGTHYRAVEIMYACRFKTALADTVISRDADQLSSVVRNWESRRHAYDFDIDGLVIKLNSLEGQQELGATSHHPRWATAYKFKAMQAESRLREVHFQVGRTGAITPVAKIDPVPLAGVTISSVSLHNEEFIRQRDLHFGDRVLIERAGEVIPYVASVIAEGRDPSQQPVQFPKACPACDHPLSKEESEAAWRCINLQCPAQLQERLIHFVSRAGMDIEGLGRDIVIRFMQEGLLSSVQGVYTLAYDKILALEGWKERSVANLTAGIEASKSRGLAKVLVALGIRFVGNTVAEKLAAETGSIEALSRLSETELCAIPDIGPRIAASVVAFFADEANLETIRALGDAGVNLSAAKTSNVEGSLSGQTFLFTGSLRQFTREEAAALVKERGGKVASSVSSKLNWLVVGESAGSKLKKAQALGSVGILSEQEFLNYISTDRPED